MFQDRASEMLLCRPAMRFQDCTFWISEMHWVTYTYIWGICFIILPTDRLQRTSCTFAPFSISSFSNRALGAAATGKVGLVRPMKGEYDPNSELSATCTTHRKYYWKICLREFCYLSMIMCKKLKLFKIWLWLLGIIPNIKKYTKRLLRIEMLK